MSETEKNMKDLILGPISAHLAKFGLRNCFRECYLDQQLEIVPGNHPRQFKEKLMSQNEENVKNVILGPILAHLGEICASKLFS